MRMTDLSVVVLCGGLGTRLREETEFKPKPMVTIGGRPILWHIMKHYRHFDLRNFVLRDFFLNYPIYNTDFAVDLGTGDVETLSNGCPEDWRVVLAETGEESLTGTRINQTLRYIPGDTFLATYGDGVSDVDIDRLLAHHRAKNRRSMTAGSMAGFSSSRSAPSITSIPTTTFPWKKAFSNASPMTDSSACTSTRVSGNQWIPTGKCSF